MTFGHFKSLYKTEKVNLILLMTGRELHTPCLGLWDCRITVRRRLHLP